MTKHKLTIEFNIIFFITLLVCISCKSENKQNGNESEQINNSTILSITNPEPERITPVENKDTVLFYQPLYMSDSDEVLSWIAIDSIDILIRDKIGEIKSISFIPFFSDNNIGYQIYPSKNTYNDFFLEGYYCLKGTKKIDYEGNIDKQCHIYKIENKFFIDEMYSDVQRLYPFFNIKDIRFPNVLGDTIVYIADEKAGENLIRKFCNAIQKKDISAAQDCVNFPVVLNIKEMDNLDFIWDDYESWNKFINHLLKDKESINFIPLFLDAYNYNGIFKQLPSRLYGFTNDGSDAIDIPSQNDPGQIIAYRHENIADYPESYTDTYVLKVLKVNGKLKICSFFHYQDNDFRNTRTFINEDKTL